MLINNFSIQHSIYFNVSQKILGHLETVGVESASGNAWTIRPNKINYKIIMWLLVYNWKAFGA